MKRSSKFSIGQYTQLVWAKTQYVGCGLAIYGDRNTTKKINNKKVYYKRLVCNYAPAGNVIDEQVYQIGAPCSKCPQGKCNNVRKHLCQGMFLNKCTGCPEAENSEDLTSQHIIYLPSCLVKVFLMLCIILEFVFVTLK